MKLEIVVAIDEQGGIGKNNQLLWHLPADLKHFKEITSGHPIIMGRKTYDSIGKPLPNRRNIVITRQQDLKIEGAEVVNSLKNALELVKNENLAFIIGGAQIFNDAMHLADTLHLTKVHHRFEADTFFPEIKTQEWQETAKESHPADEKNPYKYTFITYKKL
ncbi:MAG: dihydrofolate reductase [Sphingobacteriaceae bacterium]